MPLRSTLVISIGLLGLLCLLLPGPLWADDFTFSFTNTIGNVTGTVTGRILGLTNNTTGPATAVILDSYPADLAADPDLVAPPNTATDNTVWTVAANHFTETSGVITNFDLDTTIGARGLGIGFTGLYLYNFPSTHGAALEFCKDAVVFTRAILPSANTSPPASFTDCKFVQNEGPRSSLAIFHFAPIVSAVPEPGTADLMLLGIGLVFVMRKRIAQGLHQAT